MEDIVIVGSSGFAKEIHWLIKRMNDKLPRWNFKGYVDSDISKPEVIGDDEFLKNNKDYLNVVIAIADPLIRKKLVTMYKSNKHLYFPNLIDPSVLMSDKIVLGEGNIICAGSVLTVEIGLGNFNIINLDCTIGHEVEIKDFVTINPSVNISGKVCLENGVSIGTGTQVLQGQRIGENTVIGAGAVVTHSVPNDCTAVGIPAKVIKDRR